MAVRRFPRREDAWEATPPPAPPPAEPVEPVVEVVAPVVAPAPPPAPPAPVSGLVVVRVRGPGSVMCDGMHLAGEEFVANLTEALSLGDAVEIVG